MTAPGRFPEPYGQGGGADLASVDRAKEMGIDWWENAELRERLARLEEPAPGRPPKEAP
ncbi:hypothetical protein ACWC2T_22015 [Streptomyces sp. NPDC001393]